MKSMQCAVEKFVEAKQNGLCLIDMPTGTGKTFLTRKILGGYIRKEILQDVETIIYLTPQKKNIDDIFDALRKDFSDNPSIFDSSALRIYANYENVLEKFMDIYDKIPHQLQNRQSCKELKRQIELYNELKNSNVPKDILDGTLAEIRKHYEVAFRKDISEELSKIARTKPEKNRKLNSSEYAWIRELYPACLTDYRKVLFMTVDKFVSGNDPIISKPYRFISHSKTKNALIFIDEFDATKDVLLNQEIQNCTDYKMDLIKLFACISNTLKGREFPISIFAESTDENDKNGSLYRFNRMKKHFLEVEKRYNLNYLFKLDAPDENDRYFLFDDYQLHTITNSKTEKNIILREDKQKKQNTITISSKSDNGQFYRIIYSIKNALNVFISCCAKMAQIYMKHYNDEAKKNHRDMMEIEQAVSTIIDPYNLDYVMAKNLVNMIVDNVSIPVIDRGREVFDTDFYMNGFRYYDFKDDISHDVSTAMAMCYLDNTPEKFMLSLASKARVVGLSATASIETVTGNYNIEYLKDRLNDDFYELPTKDKESIRAYIKSRLIEWNNISVSIQGVQKNVESLNDVLSQLFDDEKNIERFSGILNKYLQGERSENQYYHINRVLKAMKAVREFLRNKTSRVLLLMTNRNIVDHSLYNIFSKEIIDGLVDALCDELKILSPKRHYLNSIEFSRQKEEYKRDIQSGETVLLFSSYNTAGTGQNLQYEIDDKEIDIDSLYLEMPTNIIVNAYELKDELNLIKLIYQYETLKTSGEIAGSIALRNIKEAFRKLMGTSGGYFDNFAYRTDSVNNNIVKILIQAVGRICRTENKNENINIYVDEDIIQRVDFSVAFKNGRMLNPEFKKVAEMSSADKKSDIHINLNKACDRNARVKTRIENMLSENRISWTERDIEQWQFMREFVLKHPTISKENLTIAIKQCYSIRDFYLEASSGEKIDHYFVVIDRETEKQIFYDWGNYKPENAVLINESNARLNILMGIPAVKETFLQAGYATGLLKNDCILLPVVYQNIYKGALGEVAGRAILEKNGVHLIEITDVTKFEKFDFCLAHNPNIYIDFKNWSDTDKVDRKEYIEKCARKLERVGGEKVFIINLVADSFLIHESYGGKVIEISSLCSPRAKDNLYQLAPKDMIKIIEMLLGVSHYGNQ